MNNDNNTASDAIRVDEEILARTLSDEALEAAAANAHQPLTFAWTCFSILPNVCRAAR
jgi:hypothetical protein